MQSHLDKTGTYFRTPYKECSLLLLAESSFTLFRFRIDSYLNVCAHNGLQVFNITKCGKSYYKVRATVITKVRQVLIQGTWNKCDKSYYSVRGTRSLTAMYDKSYDKKNERKSVIISATSHCKRRAKRFLLQSAKVFLQ